MWTKVHALAAIEARLPAAYAVDVAFRGRLFLPFVANFVAEHEDQGWGFAARPARRAGDHLRAVAVTRPSAWWDGLGVWSRALISGPADQAFGIPGCRRVDARTTSSGVNRIC